MGIGPQAMITVTPKQNAAGITERIREDMPEVTSFFHVSGLMLTWSLATRRTRQVGYEAFKT